MNTTILESRGCCAEEPCRIQACTHAACAEGTQKAFAKQRKTALECPIQACKHETCAEGTRDASVNNRKTEVKVAHEAQCSIQACKHEACVPQDLPASVQVPGWLFTVPKH